MRHVVFFMVVLIRTDTGYNLGFMMADGEFLGESFDVTLPPIMVGNMTLAGSITSHECPKVGA